jgi:sugar phosphate permease
MPPTRTYARRWRRMIPIAFVTYSLAYLDRSNFSIAAAAGMAGDLGFGPRDSSLVGAIFFLGYFIFQVPGTVLAQKLGVRGLIFWCLLAWGAFASLSGWVSSIGGLLIVRFLLGAAEATVLPALLLYISRWFTREERSTANGFLILGNPVTVVWMSIVSAYLVRLVGWRWMFIIEGFPAVAWAGLWWILADESPADAVWLGDGEKRSLEAALSREQETIHPVRRHSDAFRSPAVLCLCAHYFCWSLGFYGLLIWLPSILRQASHLGIVWTGWLAALPYLAAIPAMILTSIASDRRRQRVGFVWPYLAIASIALYASYALGASHFGLSYTALLIAGVCMYAPYGPFFAIIPEILPRNVAGGAMALVNSLGALGGFAGTFLVGYLNGSSGGPSESYILMSASLFVSAILVCFVPRMSRASAVAAR